eukprot:Phypoly_transcript_13572.p1 GENE.Phypoly_transcript_13572~~Phypoly_transcript_13572.p1  ORF type:complete len:244 (+),score=43.47 Phypoly_transcript_13572:272-1003(+)
MAQEESRGEGRKHHGSPSLARRLHRTKPAQPLVKDDSTDEISLPHSEHHKYQTIQSFRSEEVKELLSGIYDPAVNGKTSAPNEEGIRRFSLVKNNFKARRAFRNSKDAAMLRGMDEGEGVKPSSAPDNNHFLKAEPDEAQKHAVTYHSDGEHDTAHEISRLRAQLVHERTIYTREMARMRAQLRAFETHLTQTVMRMGSLLEMVDSREHAVQELLAKSMLDGEHEEKEKERKGDPLAKTIDLH